MYHGVGEKRLLSREGGGGGGLFESRPFYGKTLALVKGQIGGFSYVNFTTVQTLRFLLLWGMSC